MHSLSFFIADRCVRHQVVGVPGARGAHLAGPERGRGPPVLRAMPPGRVPLRVAEGAAPRPRHLHLRPDGQPGMTMHSLVKSIRFIKIEQDFIVIAETCTKS